MLKKLPMVLAQVKAGNTKIKFIKLYVICIEQKKLLKKVCNNIINSI